MIYKLYGHISRKLQGLWMPNFQSIVFIWAQTYREIFKYAFVDKIDKTVFFLSWAQTHQNFTFNLRFLYELKHKVRLSKILCGIFHFRFGFAFIKVYVFIQQNASALWIWNIIIPFKTKIIEKLHPVLLTDLWFLNCNKKF